MEVYRMVYCIQCKRIQHKDSVSHIFKTGFVHVAGVNYPMAICSAQSKDSTSTESRCVEHAPSQTA